MAENKHQTEHGPATYQKDEADVRQIVKFGIGLTVLVAVTMLLMGWLATFFAAHQPAPGVTASPLAGRTELPPPPRLQITPIQELHRMRASEDNTLNTYGWVDAEAGIARIPIGRAMDLIAERGLPVRAKSTTEAQRTQR